jgi:hypothetical protein
VRWREVEDLASLRTTAAIDKLPPGERDGWRKFWADVEELFQQTRNKE